MIKAQDVSQPLADPRTARYPRFSRKRFPMIKRILLLTFLLLQLGDVFTTEYRAGGWRA